MRHRGAQAAVVVAAVSSLAISSNSLNDDTGTPVHESRDGSMENSGRARLGAESHRAPPPRRRAQQRSSTRGFLHTDTETHQKTGETDALDDVFDIDSLLESDDNVVREREAPDASPALRTHESDDEKKGTSPPSSRPPREAPPGATLRFPEEHPVFGDNPFVLGEDGTFHPSSTEGADTARVTTERQTSAAAVESRVLIDPGPDEMPPSPPWMQHLGVAVLASLGVSYFPDANMRVITSPGLGYGVSVITGTRRYFALELAYLGTVQSFRLSPRRRAGILVANGVLGTIRFQFDTRVRQPYFATGLGWRRYDLLRMDAGQDDLRRSDSVVEVPLTLGLAWFGSTTLIDAHVGYRVAMGDTLMVHQRGPGLDAWDVGVRAGIELN